MPSFDRPGLGASRLALRRRVSGWMIGAATLTASLTAVELDRPLAAIGIGAAGWLGIRWMRARARRAIAGRDAERRVARMVRRARPRATLWNLWLSGITGDVDVLALGPMAAVVEVKRGQGRVRIDPDRTVRVGGRFIHGDPLRRTARTARVLSRRFGVDVDAVVCIEGMRQRPRHVDVPAPGDPDRAVVVCAARHLPRVLRRLERRLDPRAADALAGALRRADRRPP